MIEEQGDEVPDSAATVADTDDSVAYKRGFVAHLRKNLSTFAMMKLMIRASDLCQRVAIPQARHSQWVSKGLCRRIGKDGAGPKDVVELAVATLLMDALKDIEKARRAMAQLRDRFGHTGWPDDLVIIWDEQLEFAQWAGTDAEIGRLARHGRPLRVINAGVTVSAILESYRQLDYDRGVA